MDEWHFEHAAQLEELARQEGLARYRGAALPEYHPAFDGRHCVVCGDEVHPARLRMGKVRCIECQRRKEAQEAR